MERIKAPLRVDWQNKVKKYGLTFFQGYWQEGTCYRFSEAEINEIEEATAELHRMCLAAVDHIIKNNRFAELGIPAAMIPVIKWSWENEKDLSVYGRFDLLYDGKKPPKMLEYNADTALTLLEASIIQWYWLQDVFPQFDQFNVIDEELIAFWSRSKHKLSGPLYFGYIDKPEWESEMNVAYLSDTAERAGIAIRGITMQEIGYDNEVREFVDMQDRTIKSIFKMYPWDWVAYDEFADKVIESYKKTNWLEPIWKIIPSNKGILAILWELFPEHKNLLPAYLNDSRGMAEFVKKPVFSNKGDNVTVNCKEGVFETPGVYGSEGSVFQQYQPMPDFQGFKPIIGSWIIGGKPAGLGIRETNGKITDDSSGFVPHYFE